MAELEPAVLAALRALATENDVLEGQDWQVVAQEALSGSAPAQYIVASGLEQLGDVIQARKWYQLSAAQGYLPAVSRLSGQSSMPPADAPSSLITEAGLA